MLAALDKNDFPAQKQGLITSQLCPARISVIVLLLDSGRSVQEGRGDLMIGDRVCLQCLPVMITGIRPDRLPALPLNPLQKVQWKVLLIGALLSISGERPCRGAGRAGFVCCCHVSVLVC